ncbi:MAG: FIST C-terminal domain-containing protein [Candidatus Pacebacteria bacterium]|nr:FIST C-terminal domain-containing protein [Candidatus Paceibacterota bacterium]
MTTKTKVGSSSNLNPTKAGKEACLQAMEGLNNINLLIVFSSSNYDQQEMLSAIREISGDIPLIGCSSAGEIIGSGPINKSVAVMAIESDTMKCVVAEGESIKPDPKEAGMKLAKKLADQTGGASIHSVIMLIDVLTGNGADTVRGVNEVLGENTLIVGGAAGDDFSFKETYEYLNDKVLPSSIVGAGFYGDNKITVGVRHGWVPFGSPMKVTKSHGAVLEEIDGKPALSVYENYFGEEAKSLKNEVLGKMAIIYPLGITTDENDELLLRAPISADENGAITFAAEVPENSEIRLMIGSKEKAIDAAKEAAENALKELNGKKPAGVIVFNCIARQKLFNRNAKDEIDSIKEILGKDVPVIGFYTYGEIAPINGKSDIICRFHNETAVVTVIGE